jgi:hypothetical protein
MAIKTWNNSSRTVIKFSKPILNQDPKVTVDFMSNFEHRASVPLI